MDLKETDILGSSIGNHWYYASKAKAMARLLSNSSTSIILDVGAGSGFFSKNLLAKTTAAVAWCVDISYAKDSDEIHSGKHVHFRRSVDKVDADLVLLMDVLEHVDDDIALLTEYVKKVPSGAKFIISVPAFQLLWSDHDVFLEHKRRYRLNQIEDVARKSGLIVESGAYYFGFTFPIAAIIRIIKNIFRNPKQQPKSELTQHHPLINGALATLSDLELGFLPHNRVLGLTAFCVAVKP